MTDHWNTLTLAGDRQQLEIISASLLPYSCGMEEKPQSCILFFEDKQKKIVENILLNQEYEFAVNTQWSTQLREDWHLSWQENFNRIIVEDGIQIIPDWEDKPVSEKIIKIKPGMAFGTGHHETTFLMLKNLQTMIKPTMSVLDLGSGSGILAIASKKLGAAKVTAVEFDEDCRDNFNENLKLNGLAEQIDYLSMDILKWEVFNYDLILANINKNVITSLVQNLVETKADIFLTGLLVDDEQELVELLETLGFEIIITQYNNEWIFLHIKYMNGE